MLERAIQTKFEITASCGVSFHDGEVENIKEKQKTIIDTAFPSPFHSHWKLFDLSSICTGNFFN